MTDPYKSLCELARAMEPDALEVLTAVARRLTKGREQYGDLAIDNDPRDWSREAQEELLDLVVYREIERIQRHRKAGE